MPAVETIKDRSERISEDKTRVETVTREVVLRGIQPIMFDRYAGDNNTKLEWFQKLYLDDDGQTICLPTLNLSSLLTAHNTNSAPKRLLDARKFKGIANAALSYTTIVPSPDCPAVNPVYIPFLRNGKPILFGKIGPNGQKDPQSGVFLHRAVARLDKGIPNPKERPVLPLDWSLKFNLVIYPNKEIKEQQLINLIEDGGRAIGLGTFRGVFGKYIVESWR